MSALLLRCAQAFLRNGHRRRWLEDEAEGLGAPTQVADDPRTITGLVGGRPRVDVVHPVMQGVVEENRNLARGRGDRLDLADARGKPSVEGTQGGVGSPDRYRGEPQERRGPAARAARARREHLATRDLVARRQAKPGGKVLCARPGGEVVAVNLRQVLAEQRKERRANIEHRAVRLPAQAPTR
jgi:hypothetical protein